MIVQRTKQKLQQVEKKLVSKLVEFWQWDKDLLKITFLKEATNFEEVLKTERDKIIMHQRKKIVAWK